MVSFPSPDHVFFPPAAEFPEQPAAVIDSLLSLATSFHASCVDLIVGTALRKNIPVLLIWSLCPANVDSPWEGAFPLKIDTLGPAFFMAHDPTYETNYSENEPK